VRTGKAHDIKLAKRTHCRRDGLYRPPKKKKKRSPSIEPRGDGAGAAKWPAVIRGQKGKTRRSNARHCAKRLRRRLTAVAWRRLTAEEDQGGGFRKVIFPGRPPGEPGEKERIAAVKRVTQLQGDPLSKEAGGSNNEGSAKLSITRVDRKSCSPLLGQQSIVHTKSVPSQGPANSLVPTAPKKGGYIEKNLKTPPARNASCSVRGKRPVRSNRETSPFVRPHGVASERRGSLAGR